MKKLPWANAGAAAIFVVVVFREWAYRSNHPYSLGPSGELIALGVAGALVSIAALVGAHLGAQREDATRSRMQRRLLELERQLTDLQGAWDDLREEVLDDRILLHQQVEPSELRDWKELTEGERVERGLRGTEPEERERVAGLIAQAEVLRQEILVARLQALHDFQSASAEATDEAGQVETGLTDESEPTGSPAP